MSGFVPWIIALSMASVAESNHLDRLNMIDSSAARFTPAAEVERDEAPAPEGVRLRAAVLPIVVEGSLPTSDLELLRERLLEGLGRGGFELIGPDEVQTAEKMSGECESKACAVAVGAAFDATHVVRTKVTLVDRDYRVDVILADVALGGDEIASASEGCEICGVMDAAGLMETSAAVLRRKLDALSLGTTKIEVRSDPEGAVVRIDGEIVGTTPLERALPSGKHSVRVEARGHISLEREIVFVEGATETVDLTLDPLPSVLPPARWGWGALSVGVVALGGGVALTWLDRKPQKFRCGRDEGTQDRDGDCQYLWNTRWFGAGSMIAGGAMVTLGAIILLESKLRSKPQQEARRSPPRRPRVQVGPRGVTVSGRF